MRILLAEDEPVLSDQIKRLLSAEGRIVDVVHDGQEACFRGATEPYDMIILDIGLPLRDGISVLKEWRSTGIAIPVLILTARGTWSEKVDGLNAGADDYITKPFHVAEVVARLKALIRRTAGIASPLLVNGDLTLDSATGRATFAGRDVELTALELKMLNYFMHRLGRIVSQAELNAHLYTLDEARESNTIEVYVSRLRRKLGADVIKTIRGLGYRMD